MEGKTGILVADTGSEFYDRLKQALAHEPDLDVIGFASDGKKALYMIESLKPDIVLLDLVLPELDGLSIIKKINTMYTQEKPVIFLMSFFMNNAVVREAITLGARNFIRKPFDIPMFVGLLRNIDMVDKCVKGEKKGLAAIRMLKIESAITDILSELGIARHLQGYQYLREAILQASVNADAIRGITKILYPEVAKKFLTTPAKVESAIRHTIQIAWCSINMLTFHKFFGGTKLSDNRTATNSEFISAIADVIRQQTVSNNTGRYLSTD